MTTKKRIVPTLIMINGNEEEKQKEQNEQEKEITESKKRKIQDENKEKQSWITLRGKEEEKKHLNTTQIITCTHLTWEFLDTTGSTYLSPYVFSPFTALTSLVIQLVCKEIDELPFLPPQLRSLTCVGIGLKRLPLTLPPCLNTLLISHNNLTWLPPMNDHLVTLHCNNNLLTFLPYLGNNVQTLHLGHNNIRCLKQLPRQLKTLLCFKNPLTYISTFPPTLRLLDCSDCLLETLPKLPTMMFWLATHGNPELDRFFQTNQNSSTFFVHRWNHHLFETFLQTHTETSVKMRYFWKLFDKYARRKYHPTYLHERKHLSGEEFFEKVDTWKE